jgi:hypothetical protein
VDEHPATVRSARIEGERLGRSAVVVADLDAGAAGQWDDADGEGRASVEDGD